MNRLFRLLIAFGFAFALPFAASAADSDSSKAKAASATPAPDYSPVLKIFKAQGVTTAYLGRQYGLDGWLLTKEGKIQVLYVTPDGQGAVIGTMYSPDGNLVTGTQLETAKQKGLLPTSITTNTQAPASAPVASAVSTPAVSTAPETQTASSKPPGAIQAARAGEVPSERLWKQVEASTYIKFGPDDAPPFYVIMDPDCGFCQKLFTELSQKYLPANTLQLRVIPVAILGDQSVKEAAEVISVPADSTMHWGEIERHNVANLPPIAPDAKDKIEKNHQILKDWTDSNNSGTPFCVYRTKDGKVKVVLGVPHDMEAIAAEIGPGNPQP